MKICYVGQLKAKFVLSVNPDMDEVIEIKWQILQNLGLCVSDEENSYQ
jgi:isopentenyldiphosphate isomerase